MAEVAVRINGRSYPIACEDGQEEHVARLASYIDQRIADLAAEVGQVGTQRLLIMVSLLVADELSDAHGELARIREAVKQAEANGRRAAVGQLDSTLAPAVERLAQRIEAIAARLESD